MSERQDTWECFVEKQFYDGRFADPPKREPGNRVTIEDEERLRRWIDRGLISVVSTESQEYEVEDFPWGVYEGRNLSSFETREGDWDRVVACLNIWQDLPDLRATIESWYPHVDHVIAVDGAYETNPIPEPYSTDGSVEYLRDLDKVELVETEEFWLSQEAKRTVYLQRAQDGDLLFKIDADEVVYNGEYLQNVPDLDVGWVRRKDPIYERNQDMPRLYRYQDGLHYDKRHHWLFDGQGDLVCTDQRGGRGLNHRVVPIMVENKDGIARTREREDHDKLRMYNQAEYEQENVPNLKVHGHEPLRILNLTSYDPGLVVFRFHDAINTTSPHESIMASEEKRRAWSAPYQYNINDHKAMLYEAAQEADVIHCHLRYYDMMKLGIDFNRPVVIHHHGTMYRENAEDQNSKDKGKANVRLVSNLELLTYADDTYFLPNPVPVARHQRAAKELAPMWDERPFRVAHSPSKRHKKGTEEFLQAIQDLQDAGYDVEANLIEDQPHKGSVHTKAASHACFDSFWLGLQCSGLEASAAGRPVIAGDTTVRDRYKNWLGGVPYTFADNKGALKAQIIRLMENRDFWEQEARKVYSYTLKYHDHAAVVQRYLDVLDEQLDWRKRMSINRFNGPLR